MRSYKCWGPGEYFGCLRMRLRSYSRECAEQEHFGELRMRTKSMHVCLHMNARDLGRSWGMLFSDWPIWGHVKKNHMTNMQMRSCDLLKQ